MCGVAAVLVTSDSSNGFEQIQSELVRIQHRGYCGFGISRLSPGQDRVLTNRFTGRIRPFKEPLHGTAFIGHVRYTTRGEADNVDHTQPMSHGDYALAFNGQVESTHDVDTIEMYTRFQTCETESDYFHAIQCMFKSLRGAYAGVLLVKHIGIFMFRDPHGIRPLCYVRTPDKVVITSENRGRLDFHDVRPGSVTLFRLDGSKTMQSEPLCVPRPCAFEFIYFAHSDSIIEGIPVREFRQQLGRLLAKRVRDQVSTRIDWVTCIPNSSRIGAVAAAYELGVDYVETLDTLSSRSFILPTQEQRADQVKRKFQLLGADMVRNKTLLVVDDSVIRGTTCRHVVKLYRESGARKIIVGSLSPPVRYQNKYGIDIPTREELVYNKTGGDVKSDLGADQIVYVEADDLARLYSTRIEFELSMFTGRYLIEHDVESE